MNTTKNKVTTVPQVTRRPAAKLFTRNSRPKTMNITLTRIAGNRYHVVEAFYLDQVNQYDARWARVDARNAASEIRQTIRSGRLTVN